MAKGKHSENKSKNTSKQLFNSGSSWLLISLLVVTFLVYSQSLGFFITQLDDYILIFEKEQFNKLTNFFKAFTVGTFGEKDIYYRPFFKRFGSIISF